MSSLTYGSLFSGCGGLDLAVEHLTGATPAWHSEIEPAAITVHDTHWPGVPNLGDITTVDWTTVPAVDVLCGGYPCQPFSTAGKRQGTLDDRHLWPYVADAVRVLRPRLVLLENVAGHLSLGFDVVAGDLADLGYDTRWTCLPASAVGAPHRRNRLWIVAQPADADGSPWRQPWGAGEAVHEPGPVERLGRRGRLADHGGAPTDADHGPIDRERARTQPGRRDTGPAPTDARGAAFGQHAGEPPCQEEQDGRRGDGPADPGGVRAPRDGRATAWGPYGPAITRWEHHTGRPAPAPTDDRGRLNPEFPEWMMGLPRGWVTGRVTRTQALRMIGNGVCPQQAVAAYRLLLGAADRQQVPA